MQVSTVIVGTVIFACTDCVQFKTQTQAQTWVRIKCKFNLTLSTRAKNQKHDAMNAFALHLVNLVRLLPQEKYVCLVSSDWFRTDRNTCVIDAFSGLDGLMYATHHEFDLCYTTFCDQTAGTVLIIIGTHFQWSARHTTRDSQYYTILHINCCQCFTSFFPTSAFMGWGESMCSKLIC